MHVKLLYVVVLGNISRQNIIRIQHLRGVLAI